MSFVIIPAWTVAKKCRASLAFIKEARAFWWKEKLAQYAELAAKSWLPWMRKPSEATLRKRILCDHYWWNGDVAYKDKEERIDKLLDACVVAVQETASDKMLLSAEDAAMLTELRYKNASL